MMDLVGKNRSSIEEGWKMRPGYKIGTRAAGLASWGLMSSVLEGSKAVWVCEDHGLRVGWWWCSGKFSVKGPESKRR